MEVDKADKSPTLEQAAVTEVYIRGWKVDDVMMAGILAECFPAVTSLHTVDLWNVGLNDVTLVKLAEIVSRCKALRTLLLDANPVSSQRWHLLLQVAYRLCIFKYIQSMYITAFKQRLKNLFFVQLIVSCYLVH